MGDADGGEHELDDQLDPVDAAGCSETPQIAGDGRPTSAAMTPTTMVSQIGDVLPSAAYAQFWDP